MSSELFELGMQVNEQVIRGSSQMYVNEQKIRALKSVGQLVRNSSGYGHIVKRYKSILDLLLLVIFLSIIN